MEKRRRARINNCLNELKTLILDAMKKDVSILFYLVFKRLALCRPVIKGSFRDSKYSTGKQKKRAGTLLTLHFNTSLKSFL